jgi:hypothetical protein
MMNPCGAVVDAAEFGYDERREFFRNTDMLIGIRWYPARDDAPVCPFPSGMMSRYWDRDNTESDGTSLTPPDDSWKENFAKVLPEALGTHVCGNAQDWREGPLYDPLAPPVEYQPNGLPKCCFPIFKGLGGGVGDGTGTVSYTGPVAGYGGGVGGGVGTWYWSPYIWPVTGGGVGDGRGTVYSSPIVIGSGGGVGDGTGDVTWEVDVVGLGGGVGDGTGDVTWEVDVVGLGGGVGDGTGDVTWTLPGPGPTCSTALVMASGVPYLATALPFVDQWYTMPVVPGGGSWRVTITGATDPFQFTAVNHGNACASLVLVGSQFGDGSITGSTASAPFDGYATIQTKSGSTYTIQIDQL